MIINTPHNQRRPTRPESLSVRVSVAPQATKPARRSTFGEEIVVRRFDTLEEMLADRPGPGISRGWIW